MTIAKACKIDQFVKSNMSDGAIIVAIYLSLNGESDYETMSGIFQKSDVTISRYCIELEKRGVITIVRRGNAPNICRVRS